MKILSSLIVNCRYCGFQYEFKSKDVKQKGEGLIAKDIHPYVICPICGATHWLKK